MGEPSAPVGSFGKRRRRRSSRLVGGGGRGDSRVRPEERERLPPMEETGVSPI